MKLTWKLARTRNVNFLLIFKRGLLETSRKRRDQLVATLGLISQTLTLILPADLLAKKNWLKRVSEMERQPNQGVTKETRT